MTRHYGYILNDNRASGGEKAEADILTCAHCQAVIERKKWEHRGGWCGRCGTYVCFECGEKTKREGCTPFVKLIEAHLTKQARQRAFSAIAGLEGGKRDA